MRGSTVKRLRNRYDKVSNIGKVSWRRFKRNYMKLNWIDRTKFLRGGD